MPTRTPAGGRGSNQYATKGTPALPPSRAQAGVEVNVEDVAWRFDADFADWHAAGVETVEERNQWVASELGPDEAAWWYWLTTPTDLSAVDACRQDPDLQIMYVGAAPDRYGEVFLRSASDLDALRGWVEQFAKDQLRAQMTAPCPVFGPAATLEYVLRHGGTVTVTAHAVDRDHPRPVLVFLDDGQGHTTTETFTTETEANAWVRDWVNEDWASVEGYDDEPGDRVNQYFEHHADAFYAVVVDYTPLTTAP